ncbi:hypothetical protein Y032_0166g77 [Ancylostoma ceylanicum]|uniref:Uncharacterized protein n=1 Tax=Ancylostoma ceylanicum TaxID=53326 RepID=A0A016SWV3_9BILA|nr:hypothetical protein Y032_0166g77 [Ancylostoma ceylanicum]
MGHKRKLDVENGDADVAYPAVEINGINKKDVNSPSEKRKSKTSRDRFALYLIRKPIEITPEDLSDANISLDTLVKDECKIAIGDHDFVVRGADLPTQTFHIPAGVIHGSEGSSAKSITGSVVISRAEFDKSEGIFEEGHDVPLDLIQDLPLKPIKKKVSRKGIQRLQQRLSATGVKKLKNDSVSDVKEET